MREGELKVEFVGRLGGRGRAVLVSLGLLLAAQVPALPHAGAAPGCWGYEATVEGTNGDDRLEGTNGPDIIDGRGGNDVIYGRGGNDFICGGGGRDEIKGGRGPQIIAGEAGKDVLNGGSGRDKLFGGDGADRLLGETQGDLLLGDAGNDRLNVGDSTQGRDRGYGGLGDDTLWTTGHDDDEGAPTELHGNEGNDRLIGLSAAHGLFGGPDDDTLEGGSATYKDLYEGVSVDLGSSIATGDGTDTLIDVAGVVGSDYADVIYGAATNDRLFGMAGDDEIDGRDGEDVLDGGLGVDSCANGETEESCES